MLIVMLISAMTFIGTSACSAIVSERPAFQTVSSMVMMPLTFVSGADPHDDNAWFPPAGGLSEPAAYTTSISSILPWVRTS